MWVTVTSLENYRWRNDLSKIEILSGGRFTEYTKDGYPTTFTVTAAEEHKHREFDMEKVILKGIGRVFTPKKTAAQSRIHRRSNGQEGHNEAFC